MASNPFLQLALEEERKRKYEDNPFLKIADEEEARAKWGNVQGGVASTEDDAASVRPEEDRSSSFAAFMAGGAGGMANALAESPAELGGAVGESFMSGVNRSKAGLARADLDFGNMLQSGAGAINALLPEELRSIVNPLGNAAGDAAAWFEPGVTRRLESAKAQQQAYATENQQSLAAMDSDIMRSTAKILSAGANPESLSSMLPGVGAPAAGVIGFLGQYEDLRSQGASPAEAAKWALPLAGAEFAGAKLGAGVGNAIPNALTTKLGNTLGRAGAKFVGSTAEESFGEGLTSLMQSGLQASVADTTTNPQVREYANLQAANWGQNLWDSLVAGGALKAPVAAPQAAIQYAAEQGAYAQKEIELAARFAKDAEKRRAKLAANDFLKEPAGATPVNPLRPDGAQTKPQFFEPDAAAPAAEPDVEAAQDEDVANIPSSSLMDEMKSRGMAQETGNVTTSVTPQRVVEALAGGRGKRENNIITEMLYRNKVQLVEDVSEIPSNAVEGAGGWYDGENVYVVANKLNEDSIIPDLLSIMSHETKHGVDASGFVNPLGKQANDSIISQVKALAERGDAGAIDAWTKATGGTNYNDDLTEEQKMEVASYSINNAMDAQTGPIKGVVRTAMAAWRDTTRKAGVNEVKLDDLRYLTKNMLESVATSDRSLKGELPNANEVVGGMAMFLGDRAKTANLPNLSRAFKALRTATTEEEREAIRQDTGWFRGRDGKMRFEISDSNADFMPAFFETGGKDDLFKKDSKPLGEVLKHDALFEAYPWLRDIKLSRGPYFLDIFNSIWGDANYEQQTTNINPNITPEQSLSTLLHEVQHLVQGYESWARGGNQQTVGQNMTPAQLRKEIPGLIEAVDKSITPLLEEQALYDEYFAVTKDIAPALTQSGKDQEALWQLKKATDPSDPNHDRLNEEWLAAYREHMNLKEQVKKRLAHLSDHPAYWRLTAYRPEELQKTLDGINDAIATSLQDKAALENGDIDSVRDVAKKYNQLYQFYRRLSGETEARTTELRRTMTDEERRAKPPVQSRIEANEVLPDQEILIRRGLNVASESKQGMAQIVTPRDRAQAESKKPISQDSWLGKAWTAVTRSVAGDENLGRQLNEIKLNSSARAASLSVAAEQASHKMERAMMKAADLRKVDRETIADRINEVLEEANKLDDSGARKSAIAALDRQYPGTNLGTQINKMRELTWELASEMVRERALDPRPLTKKEKNTYVKILDNAERWTTRAYQSQMSGRELYAKTFMERAKDVSSEEAKNLAAAIELIKSGYLGLPSKKTLNDLSTAKLTELYKAWDAGNSRGLREAPNNRADLIDRLTELNITDGKRLNEKAMEIAKDLIGINKEPGAAAAMIRGMRQNRTVLEARQKIPKELRNIMGEVTDPRLRMSISAARLTQLVASTKALRNVYDQGENIWWSSEKSDKFTEQLNSPTFGALDGKYVSKDAQHMLGAYTNFNASFDTELKDVLEKPNKGVGKAAETLGSIVRPLGRWYKFSSVMLSTSNMMLNFAGAGLTLAKNGVTNPKHVVMGFIDTAALLATQKLRNASPERMAKNQELLLAGVTDSAQAQEFRSALWNRIHKALRNGNTDSDIRHMWNRVGDIKDSGKDLIGEVYAFMDVWSKTATYYNNKEFLTEYNKAENLGWTDEQIIREAGYDTTMSTVSYNRASPLIKAIERNVPFGAAFLVYKAEAIRSVFGGLVVAKRYAELARDAKTAKGRNAAAAASMKLIGGTLAATGGVIAATMGALGDEDEKDRLKRILFPDWEQDKIHVFLGTDDKGKEHYASLNRIDPIGPANEPVVTFLRAIEQDKGVGEATIKALDDFITTFKVYNDAGKLVGDLAAETFGNGASQYTRKTLFDGSSFAEKIKDSASYGNLGANSLAIAESLIPSQFAVWADQDRLAIDGNAAKALKALGYKDVVVDPEQSLGFRAGDYNKGIRELQGKKAALLKSSSNPEALLERIYDLQDKEKELFENLSESALSYRQFNKPPMFEGKPQDTKAFRSKADAAAVLEGRKVNKDVITDVLNGSFYPTIVDDEIVDKWYEAQTKQIERTDPDYKAKMESAEAKADMLEKALRAKRSDN